MVRWKHIFPDESKMECLSTGTLIIDPSRFLVMKNGTRITLTKTEFSILYLMMSTKGRIHSRNAISQYAWGTEHTGRTRTIDTHISNIRKKIGRVNEREVITVIKGVGYKLDDSFAE
jgi:two-component system alkaline phosphatase synthesis response regulator PhoP